MSVGIFCTFARTVWEIVFKIGSEFIDCPRVPIWMYTLQLQADTSDRKQKAKPAEFQTIFYLSVRFRRHVNDFVHDSASPVSSQKALQWKLLFASVYLNLLFVLQYQSGGIFLSFLLGSFLGFLLWLRVKPLLSKPLVRRVTSCFYKQALFSRLAILRTDFLAKCGFDHL